MNLLGGRREVHLPEQRLVVGMPREAPVLLLEQTGVVSLDRASRLVVAAVSLHGVDEEKAEDLDSLRAQAYLLVEMLGNGSPNHLALNGCGVHIAPGFAFPEKALAARYAKLDERISPLDPDLADTAVAIDGAACRLFEIVAVLNPPFRTPRASGGLDIEFDLRADDARLLVVEISRT